MSDDTLTMYETQHFGFTPQSCLDGMYNAVQEYVYSVLKAVEDCVLENVPSAGTDPGVVKKVRHGTQMLIDHMKSQLDMTFELIEIFCMERVFAVPPGVLLPEDLPHAAPLVDDGDTEGRLDAELAELRRRHRHEMAVQARLEAELEEQRAVQAALEAAARRLDELERMWRERAGTDAAQALAFCLQRVQQLHERAADVRAAGTAGAGGTAGAARSDDVPGTAE